MNEDSLFRAAEHTIKGANDSFERLKTLTDADLFAALVVQLQSGTTRRAPNEDADTRSASSFPWGAELAVNLDSLPRDTNTRDLGHKIFLRWSKVLYGFACGPGKEDSDLREHLLEAVSGKSGGGMAIIIAVLTSYFGVSPPVAAIIAALTVRFIVSPAAEGVCHSWATVLGVAENATKR
jgi:hypothetical protein